MIRRVHRWAFAKQQQQPPPPPPPHVTAIYKSKSAPPALAGVGKLPCAPVGPAPPSVEITPAAASPDRSTPVHSSVTPTAPATQLQCDSGKRARPTRRSGPFGLSTSCSPRDRSPITGALLPCHLVNARRSAWQRHQIRSIFYSHGNVAHPIPHPHAFARQTMSPHRCNPDASTSAGKQVLQTEASPRICADTARARSSSAGAVAGAPGGR